MTWEAGLGSAADGAFVSGFGMDAGVADLFGADIFVPDIPDDDETIDCAHFQASECGSCVLIETPRSKQLADKQAHVARVLADFVPESAWLPAAFGGSLGFRNKAKFVVGGSAGKISLGLWALGAKPVDLTDCKIQDFRINAAGVQVREFLARTGLAPYDVQRRLGELKFVHITVSDAGDLLIRFVVRSERAAKVIAALRKHLLATLPNISLLTVNMLPEHKAVLEGDDEWILHGDTLRMPLAGVELDLLPRSFFQTNSYVAGELYRQAAMWVCEVKPESLWDLYCGVGGFALVCGAVLAREQAGSGRLADSMHAGMAAVASDEMRSGRGDIGSVTKITGVEVSEDAVKSARLAGARAGIAADFIACDATEFALSSAVSLQPDLIIVNPPRRGIGQQLAQWLEKSSVQTVIYSSCNPASLANDLGYMPGFEAISARLFDMFPHTKHAEVAVLLRRQ